MGDTREVFFVYLLNSLALQHLAIGSALLIAVGLVIIRWSRLAQAKDGIIFLALQLFQAVAALLYAASLTGAANAGWFLFGPTVAMLASQAALVLALSFSFLSSYALRRYKAWWGLLSLGFTVGLIVFYHLREGVFIYSFLMPVLFAAGVVFLLATFAGTWLSKRRNPLTSPQDRWVLLGSLAALVTFYVTLLHPTLSREGTFDRSKRFIPRELTSSQIEAIEALDLESRRVMRERVAVAPLVFHYNKLYRIDGTIAKKLDLRVYQNPLSKTVSETPTRGFQPTTETAYRGGRTVRYADGALIIHDRDDTTRQFDLRRFAFWKYTTVFGPPSVDRYLSHVRGEAFLSPDGAYILLDASQFFLIISSDGYYTIVDKNMSRDKEYGDTEVVYYRPTWFTPALEEELRAMSPRSE